MPELTDVPEFCPNRRCRFHSRQRLGEYQWYTRYGRYYTQARGWIQRFRCTTCGTSCSTQTFSLAYWTRAPIDMQWLLHHLYGCGGLRQIGRFAGVTYRVIQNRIRRLARNSLAIMDCVGARHQLREDLAMDGIESYTRSQYHPNNITHIVGSESQFIYATVHTTLRRSGAMTAYQRAKRSLVDTVWQPPRTLSEDCAALLADMTPAISSACRRRTVQLTSDKHEAYQRAISAVPALAAALANGRLIFRCVSSRAARTTVNPLFPVNYVDRQLRMHLAEHVRETTRQGREVNCQMERAVIFMVMHNFFSPHRVDDRATIDDSSRHASHAGAYNDDVIRQLDRFTTHRHVWTHTLSGSEWIRRIWLHDYENPPSVRLRGHRVSVRSVALRTRQLPRHFLA